jgi:hypothetical protein
MVANRPAEFRDLHDKGVGVVVKAAGIQRSREAVCTRGCTAGIGGCQNLGGVMIALFRKKVTLPNQPLVQGRKPYLVLLLARLCRALALSRTRAILPENPLPLTVELQLAVVLSQVPVSY